MLNKIHEKTITFSGTTSGVLRMNNPHTLLAIRVPAGFTDCSLTFQVSNADDQTADASIADWAQLYLDNGSPYTVTVDADATNPRLILLAANAFGNFVRFVSSAPQTLSVIAYYRGIQ